MKFPILLALLSFTTTIVAIANDTSYEFKRLNINDTLLLIIDHQVGLFQLVRDYAPDEFKKNILAHAELGVVFGLPTIITTSAEEGPNGPLPKEIIEMHSDATFIQRQGEVNAWDNSDFRAAVEATGRKQIIIAGITTDVCTTFVALSLRAAGYDVWANADASGAFDQRIANDANDRMRSAGITVLSMFSIVADLMRDWRNVPGAAELVPFFDKYLSAYGFLVRGHGAAIENGTLIPGEVDLLYQG